MKKANPLKKCKLLKAACKAVGFEVKIPPRYRLDEIYTVSGKILELRFPSVIVRKSKYDKNNVDGRGISGVYPGSYPNDCNRGEFESKEIKGIEYWNGSAQKPKAYLAVWDDIEHKYSYSVYAPKGIKLKSMSTWQKKFK